MRKFIATVICLVALGSAAIPVDAQTRRRSVERRVSQVRQYNQRAYNNRYDPTYDRNVYRNGRVYRDDRWDNDIYDDRSTWDKHRDKITTAGGAVAGAVIGGLIGGKKGAIIGAITGGGGAALWTYKIRDKDDRY